MIFPKHHVKIQRKHFFISSSTPYLVVCGLIDRRKKKRLLFNVKDSSLFDKGDICLYQEVARMPPFARKCLILIGAQGVGRRTLKNRLLALDPERFGTTKPCKNRSISSNERHFFLFSSHFTSITNRGRQCVFLHGSRRNGK